MHPTAICRLCEHCQPPPYNGPVACLIDGKDIIQHYLDNDCPENKFTQPVDPKVLEAMRKQASGCKGCGDPGAADVI